MAVKVHDLISMVESDGWQLVRQSGSWREFWHPCKYGAVTVSGAPGEVVKPGTLSNVLRQAGLERSW